jgi:hypothetical protein
MNASIAALFISVAMIIGSAVVVLAEHHNTTQEVAERCIHNGGKPIRVDGTTYCLDARLFVPN